MRVVSGTARREVIHFEAPPSAALPSEMKRFLAWWNGASKASDGLLRAGLAHLYFVTVHPFDDGNGRLARALTDMALAQDERSAIRYYSLSARIHSERDGYYEALESAQRGGLDVTDWLLWFLACFERAVGQAQETTSMALGRAELGRRVSALSLSDRQRKVLAKLIEAGPGGFEGGLTTRKYVAMTGASRATAFREIDELVRDHLLLPRSARGRSQAYDLIWPAPGEAKG
jgi:Fic family protein